MVVQPNATVNINVGRFDSDGSTGEPELRLLENSTLTIDAAQILDAHSGPFYVWGGNLNVTTNSGQWAVDGFMQIGNGPVTSTVSGSTMHVLPAGFVQFGSTSKVTAPLLVDGALDFANGTHRVDDITLTAGSAVTFQAGHLISETIRMDRTMDFNFNRGALTFKQFDTSSETTAGTLTNSGGTLQPGDPIGAATIDGNYT